MGLTIINKRDGSGITAAEFKHKVKIAKRLLDEICEDTETMIEEAGEFAQRDSYRDGYQERGRYRDEYERFSERRR